MNLSAAVSAPGVRSVDLRRMVLWVNGKYKYVGSQKTCQPSLGRMVRTLSSDFYARGRPSAVRRSPSIRLRARRERPRLSCLWCMGKIGDILLVFSWESRRRREKRDESKRKRGFGFFGF